MEAYNKEFNIKPEEVLQEVKAIKREKKQPAYDNWGKPIIK